tara:strand:+ start:265 stop:528 length:264 start_codon:yes stop_codon:yes gene_type:complete
MMGGGMMGAVPRIPTGSCTGIGLGGATTGITGIGAGVVAGAVGGIIIGEISGLINLIVFSYIIILGGKNLELTESISSLAALSHSSS